MHINRTDDTKTRIMKSTIMLFNRYGILVPMSKISDMAGVAEGTPFKHFKTKDELLLATYRYARASSNALSDRMDVNEPVTEILIKSILRTIFRWATQFPDEHEYVEKYEDTVCFDSFSDEFKTLYVGIVDELNMWDRIKADVRTDMPKEIISRIISVQCGVFVRYMRHNEMKPGVAETDALIEASVDSIWRSIEAVF